jgi:hypothetical protein
VKFRRKDPLIDDNGITEYNGPLAVKHGVFWAYTFRKVIQDGTFAIETLHATVNIDEVVVGISDLNVVVAFTGMMQGLVFAALANVRAPSM